jgi:hypothetical protein
VVLVAQPAPPLLSLLPGVGAGGAHLVVRFALAALDQRDAGVAQGVVDQAVEQEGGALDPDQAADPLLPRLEQTLVEPRHPVAVGLQRAVLFTELRAEDVDPAAGTGDRLGVAGGVAARPPRLLRRQPHDLPAPGGGPPERSHRLVGFTFVGDDPEGFLPAVAVGDRPVAEVEDPRGFVVRVVDLETFHGGASRGSRRKPRASPAATAGRRATSAASNTPAAPPRPPR